MDFECISRFENNCHGWKIDNGKKEVRVNHMFHIYLVQNLQEENTNLNHRDAHVTNAVLILISLTYSLISLNNSRFLMIVNICQMLLLYV